MSARKSIAVTRNYRLAPDNCARALELLLKKSVRKKGGHATAPDDAKKESKHVGAKTRIP
jgi:hypothetical protein